VVKNTRRNILAPQTTLESSEYAAGQIRDAIVAGLYKPGERLVEIDLATQLQVSRHPIREALRRLSREGFVDVRPNRGAVVAEVDAPSILEVYELRSAIGSLALRHLIIDGKPPIAAHLKPLAKMAQMAVAFAANDSQAEMIHHDLEFQAMIVEASGLRRASVFFRELGTELQRFINLLRIQYPDRVDTAKRDVVGLYEAIAAGDLKAAETVWHDKMKTGARRLIALVNRSELAKDPQWRMFTEASANLEANQAVIIKTARRSKKITE
jgi:DNA-binding GntR family transcriptional regulator